MPLNTDSLLSDPARVHRIVTQVILLVAAAAAIVWMVYELRMILCCWRSRPSSVT